MKDVTLPGHNFVGSDINALDPAIKLVAYSRPLLDPARARRPQGQYWLLARRIWLGTNVLRFRFPLRRSLELLAWALPSLAAIQAR